MFRRIGFVAPQDEILFVPAHHQHAGADFGIGNGVDVFFNGMHTITHRAFKSVCGGETQLLIFGNQRFHAFTIGSNTLRQRIKFHAGLRCRAAFEGIDGLRNPAHRLVELRHGIHVPGKQEVPLVQAAFMQSVHQRRQHPVPLDQRVFSDAITLLHLPLPQQHAGDDGDTAQRSQRQHGHAMRNFERRDQRKHSTLVCETSWGDE